MSNPSLLCVPYRFKTSKLYSQIPDSGLGDFVVTRSASNAATRVNAQGFIETVADNVPRLDYPIGGIAAGCPALLVEPSAQNTWLQSANANSWLKLDTNVTSDTQISPDGTQNADTVTAIGVGSIPHLIYQNLSFTSGTTYTLSVFAKANTSNFVQLVFAGNLIANSYANFDLSNGTITASAFVTPKIQNMGNGWYRCSVTATASVSATNSQIIYLINSGTAPRAQSFTTTGESIYLFGGQFEASSIATSYIPTAASPVTRGNESCTATVGPFNSGSIYIAISDNDPQPGPGTHSSGALAVLGASSLNLHLSRSNNSRNRLWTQAASVIYTTTQDNLRLAFTWSGANINVFQNGTKVITDSPYAITGVHTIRFGPPEVRNRITALAVYNSVLTDAQLQSLTQ